MLDTIVTGHDAWLFLMRSSEVSETRSHADSMSWTPSQKV